MKGSKLHAYVAIAGILAVYSLAPEAQAKPKGPSKAYCQEIGMVVIERSDGSYSCCVNYEGFGTSCSFADPGACIHCDKHRNCRSEPTTPKTRRCDLEILEGKRAQTQNTPSALPLERLNKQLGLLGRKPTNVAPVTPTAPLAREKKPDLRIVAVGGPGWAQRCEAGRTLFYLVVHVRNEGTASAERPIAVEARDLHSAGGVPWTSSGFRDLFASQVPMLAPGRTAEIDLAIPYLAGNPYHMVDQAPHPFRVTVDPANAIAETNEANNTFDVSVPKPPMRCALPPKPQPPGARPALPLRDGKWPAHPGPGRPPSGAQPERLP